MTSGYPWPGDGPQAHLARVQAIPSLSPASLVLELPRPDVHSPPNRSNGLPTADSTSSSSQVEENGSWGVILEAMAEVDEKIVDGWMSELQNTLTFAGLFSAVVTTFVAGYYTTLQDPSNSTNALLYHDSSQQHSLAVTSGTPAPMLVAAQPSQHFTPTSLAVTVNRFWMTSLAMSLVAALFAITVYPWLREYKALSRFTTEEGVLMRELRQRSLYVWGVPLIISSIPLLLEIAVILFLTGLAQLLSSLSYEVFLPFASFLYVSLVFFTFTLLAPLFIPTCPYKSPTSFAILYLAKALLWLGAFLFCVCIGAPVLLCAEVITAALRCVPSLGQTADAWKAMLSIRFWAFAAYLLSPVFGISMGRRFFGGEYWACRERAALADRDHGELYASALSWARKFLPKKYQSDLKRCYESLPGRTQVMTAARWIAHALHTESTGLVLREGTAINSALLKKIDRTFADQYLKILVDALPKTWPGDKEEQAWGPSFLLVLHHIAKNVEVSDDFLCRYAEILVGLRESQINNFDTFKRELGSDHPGARLPSVLLYERSEARPAMLKGIAFGDMLSWTRSLFKVSVSNDRWINSLEVLYCSSAIVVSILVRRLEQLDGEVVQFLDALNRLLSAEEAHTKALSRMHSECWNAHGVPFLTFQALLAIHRDLKHVVHGTLLGGSRASDARLAAERSRLLIEGLIPSLREGV